MIMIMFAVLYELVKEENSQEMAPQKRMKIEAPPTVVQSIHPPAIVESTTVIDISE